MSNRDYLAFVEDMIDAIDKIIRYMDTVSLTPNLVVVPTPLRLALGCV